MKPFLAERLDVIIAADVVFDSDFHDAFLDTLRTLSLGTPEQPRRPPARIILAMAFRTQEVEDFLASAQRHNMELSELVMRPGPDPWASDVGIYDCFFHPPASSPPLKAARSLSDASTACSTPSSTGVALVETP